MFHTLGQRRQEKKCRKNVDFPATILAGHDAPQKEKVKEENDGDFDITVPKLLVHQSNS